jgi:hypothetical protein
MDKNGDSTSTPESAGQFCASWQSVRAMMISDVAASSTLDGIGMSSCLPSGIVIWNWTQANV